MAAPRQPRESQSTPPRASSGVSVRTAICGMAAMQLRGVCKLTEEVHPVAVSFDTQKINLLSARALGSHSAVRPWVVRLLVSGISACHRLQQRICKCTLLISWSECACSSNVCDKVKQAQNLLSEITAPSNVYLLVLQSHASVSRI